VILLDYKKVSTLNIIEKDESAGTQSSRTIKVKDIESIMCTFSLKEEEDDDMFAETINIYIKGGEALTYGENPTLFRLADEFGLLSETSNIRKFEYEYLIHLSKGFEVESEED